MDETKSMFREVKAAKNQSLFREVNERLKEVGEHSKSSSYADGAICECADTECSERISLTNEEYEELRQQGNRFAVAPGEEHVFPEVERVTAKHENYWIVEKVAQAAVIAEKLDPRRRQTIRQSS